VVFANLRFYTLRQRIHQTALSLFRRDTPHAFGNTYTSILSQVFRLTYAIEKNNRFAKAFFSRHFFVGDAGQVSIGIAEGNFDFYLIGSDMFFLTALP
jgi:hypothetical protein